MFMISLSIIFGLFFTIFSIQNTDPVTLVYGSLSLPKVPVYIVVLASLLIGVIFAWIFSAIDNISTFFVLNKKDNTIRELKKTMSELIKRVHQLEIDKENLKKGKKLILAEKEDENSL